MGAGLVPGRIFGGLANSICDWPLGLSSNPVPVPLVGDGPGAAASTAIRSAASRLFSATRA